MFVLTIYVVGYVLTVIAASWYDAHSTGKLVLSDFIECTILAWIWPLIFIVAVYEAIVEHPIWKRVIWRKK